MTRFALAATAALLTLAAPSRSAAQTFRTDDSTIRQIWAEGMERSMTERYAQVLMDSIGMRLSGTTGFQAAVDWLQATYRTLGVPARAERYGTTRGWRMGAVAMTLIAPRTQSLEVHLQAWSPGTANRPVEGEAIVLPLVADSAEGARWLATVRGKFVLVSPPEVMCRAAQELERNARPATVARIAQQRAAVRRDWAQRARPFGMQLHQRLQEAGAAGIVTSWWSEGWGVNKIMGSALSWVSNDRIPTVDRIPTTDLSCEDYGLVWRLATNRQGPRLRLTADAEHRPDQPMFNVIAELRGTELPNEYIVLGAHLDSWHSATGATDNGTGTIMMLETMRILSRAYPRPRRTIIIGHWGAEEQGLIGSRAFTEDHPEILQGMQVAFNQDNGTWRVELIEGQGFLNAGANLATWLSRVPTEISANLRLDVPGNQDNAGSDHSAFICHGVPTFRFQSGYDEYRQYTWHTNRDTYDKIVFDDLRNNATLAAMMAYAASEDPTRVPRDRAVLPPGPSGRARSWPTCSPATRAPVVR